MSQAEIEKALLVLFAERLGSAEIPKIALNSSQEPDEETIADLLRRMHNSASNIAAHKGPMKTLYDCGGAYHHDVDLLIQRAGAGGELLSIGGVKRNQAYWLRLYWTTILACRQYTDDKPSVDDLYACVGLMMFRAYDEMVLSKVC